MSLAPLRKKYLGEVLLAENLITREQLREVLAEQQETKEKLGAIFIKKGLITEEDLYHALATCYRLSFVKLGDVHVEEEVLKILPEKTARRFQVFPLSKKDNLLTIATSDPSNVAAIDEIEAATKMKLSMVLAAENDIEHAIERFYAGGFLDVKDLPDDTVGEISSGEEAEFGEDDVSAADAAPVIKYVNALLYEAVTKLVSDIHIEPEEHGVSLRMRIDGSLRESTPPPHKFYSAIVSRIKIIAGLDISERRLPQDGKCKVKIGDKKIDVRVSTLPTIYGEKVVMRVLDRGNITLKIDDLGFAESDVLKFQDALANPYGMVLVTGPTGSGKTTTLYTGLHHINKPERNIVTVEDPVEYELKKINQVQVKPGIGLTFANILRSVLRQDPDVIMVGEIRDKETAEIAVQAALTGHLVLSTLHTNDAVSSLSRLQYMGIEPFLIADAVEIVVAQRLVRRICPECKEVQEIPDNVRERLCLSAKDRAIPFYHGRGCSRCAETGYRGRTSINEVLRVSTEIKKMIIADKGDIAIKEQAMREGMRTLREHALDKLKAGITSIDEVLTVTAS